MDKISVIIPCHDVEAYIDRCLESVVSQSIGLDRMEIIAVNDASTDGTLKKLYEWEKRFPDHILCISHEGQPHLGAGGARNLGMQYAAGEYIGFVDADDWIEKEMYALLYEKMYTGKYDLVRCKYNFFGGIGQTDSPCPQASRHDVEYRFTPRSGLYYGEVTEVGNCGKYTHAGPCCALYKASVLKENAICFPERLAFEDNYFSGILKLYVKSLYILDAVLYHYCYNPQSTTSAVNAKHHLDSMAVALMFLEECKKRGAFEAYHDEIERDFLKTFFMLTWENIFLRFTYIPDIMSDMKKIILELFPNYKKNPYLFKCEQELPLSKLLESDDWRLEDLEMVKTLLSNAQT